MNEYINHLAWDLDEFAFDYDYYGYVDSFDDRNQGREELKQNLLNAECVEQIVHFLTEIVSEHDVEWEGRAQRLIDRISLLLYV